MRKYFPKLNDFKVLVRYYWIEDQRQGYITRIEIKYIELLCTDCTILKKHKIQTIVLSMVLLISSKVFYPRYLLFKKTFN